MEIAMYILIRILSGILISFFVGMTGVGGGVLGIPILKMLIALPMSVAVGTNNLYIFLNALHAVYLNFKKKNINFNVALWFLSGALPADILTSILLMGYLKRTAGDVIQIIRLQNTLKNIVVFTLILTVFVMIGHILRKGPNALQGDFKPSIWRKMLSIFAGFLIGGLIGLTSIGGGVLVVPVLIGCYCMPSHMVVGTSILIAGVLTGLSSFIYFIHGQVDCRTTVLMLCGSFIGGYLGNRVMIRISEKKLRICILVVILIVAVMMLFNE